MQVTSEVHQQRNWSHFQHCQHTVDNLHPSCFWTDSTCVFGTSLCTTPLDCLWTWMQRAGCFCCKCRYRNTVSGTYTCGRNRSVLLCNMSPLQDMPYLIQGARLVNFYRGVKDLLTIVSRMCPGRSCLARAQMAPSQTGTAGLVCLVLLG